MMDWMPDDKKKVNVYHYCAPSSKSLLSLCFLVHLMSTFSNILLNNDKACIEF